MGSPGDLALAAQLSIVPPAHRIQRHDRKLAQQMKDATNSFVLNLGEGAYSDPGMRCSRYQSSAGSAGEVRVTTVIDAPADQVWRAIEDISSHVTWMHDAVAIRFTSRRHSGVGTTFDCDTRVGPLRLTDRMEVTRWKPRRAMGVRHVGLVTGDGVFTLRRARRGRTRFTWTERLRFPWWMGGPFGATVGGEVLRLIWRRNLGNLKRLVEA